MFLLFSFFLSSQVETKLVIGGFKSKKVTPLNMFPFDLVSNNSFENRIYRNYGLNIVVEFYEKVNVSLEVAFHCQ